MPTKRGKKVPVDALVPARTPNEKHAVVLQKVFESVNPDDLRMALLESGNQKAITLAERLDDKSLSRLTFAKHCAELNLMPKEVWNILIDSRKTEARLRLSASLSGIVQAVADAALPRVVDCRKCRDGVVRGKDGSESDCTFCGGVGQVLKEPSLEAQKLALEMGEMVNQKVPLIAQQFNSFKGPGAGGGFEQSVPDMSDWSRESDSLFEENAPGVIEAEVVQPSE